MWVLTSKLEPHFLSEINSNTQITYSSNFKALMLRYKLQKFWPHEPLCANEYAKEKNTTISAKCHGVFLKTISDYLHNNILV